MQSDLHLSMLSHSPAAARMTPSHTCGVVFCPAAIKNKGTRTEGGREEGGHQADPG